MSYTLIILHETVGNCVSCVINNFTLKLLITYNYDTLLPNPGCINYIKYDTFNH